MSGVIRSVAGPVVSATGLPHVRIYDVVFVGRQGLVGEVIRLQAGIAVIQVYEETSGLCVGEPVESSGGPLSIELGPGLLGSIFDGLQRPLPYLVGQHGPWFARGLAAPALPLEKRWAFRAVAQAGQPVSAGDFLGTVRETAAVEHRILAPPGVDGTLIDFRSGNYSVEDTIGWVEGEAGVRQPIGLAQRWPVRRPRPYYEKLDPSVPMISGQRVVDAFFPMANGGTAIIPGGFGTGKTVMEQSLAKYVDADIVVYVGCGERGNEMTEVLAELPELTDPHSGESLMQRTILIANTSNMPVAAREASIYTGITIAEYFRDMGYSVALLADSTSRWGEALREVSGRLEEMPGEEGYPAYLNTRLADFYERAGCVKALGRPQRQGSVSIVGAVSPPGGDFSEPMTQASLRVAGAFWGLDTGLARRRHFPAVNWRTSYSLYDLAAWFDENIGEEWAALTAEAAELLQQEEALQEIVQLVGADTLPPGERAILAAARRLREDFLQQSAFDPGDAFCPPHKTYLMLEALLDVGRVLSVALESGRSLEELLVVPELEELSRIKSWSLEQIREELPDLVRRITSALES